MTTPNIALSPPARREPSVALPLVLIAIGIAFLLANAGYISGVWWQRLAEIWPILLVLIGVDLLLRPRSMAAAVIAAMLIIGLSFVYVLSSPALPLGQGTSTGGFPFENTVTRQGATQLAVTLDYGAGELGLTGGASDLVNVKSSTEDVDVQDIIRTGSQAAVILRSSAAPPIGSVDRRWDVRLPSDIPTALTLNLGAGKFHLDLHAVAITRATINNGASDLVIDLPGPDGDVPITISTGASSVLLRVPNGVAYRVRTSGGLNSFSGAQESAAYPTASDRLTITISSAASSITVR